ncbi:MULTISPECIES: isochorismatase family protein [unclassified Janibacter]|uniref:isochorismatase family protein n=1 Tax=unclassified Janibacter TaxID=2649294 RepID=UPI003D0123A5
MTTLENRPNTALLIIDMQRGVIDGHPTRDETVAKVEGLVDKARALDVPVVWVQHSSDHLAKGSESWEYAPELTATENEPVVHKLYGDAFEATDLEAVLADRGVGRVVVAGAQTDACVRSTLHGAFVRGYDTTLVADAHMTCDLTEYGAPSPALVVAHTNLYWENQSAPGRTAAVVKADEVDFGHA